MKFPLNFEKKIQIQIFNPSVGCNYKNSFDFKTIGNTYILLK